MITIIIALLSLTGVIVFFRIDQVTEILIGDGKSILERQNEIPLEPIDKNRLRDAVFRRNIFGVEEGILKTCKKEKEIRDKLNPTGPSNYVLFTFMETKRFLGSLKLFLVIDISLMLILGIYMFLVEQKFITSEMNKYVGILYYAFILYINIYTIFKKTPHEKNKIEECKKLINNS